jgi:hypothetical protein
MGLLRIAVVRVEHDGIGAEPPELAEIVEDLVQGAGAGEPVSRRAMRGASVGRVLLVTASRRKGRVTRSGCQAASNLMARRIAAALLPPTQMGTGDCAPHASRNVARYSSVSRPRLANCTPSASNSCRAPPIPTPSTSRPPLSSWRLRAMRATSSGCRYGSTITVVPSRTRVVMPASQDSMVKGSKDGSGYRTATSGVTTS